MISDKGSAIASHPPGRPLTFAAAGVGFGNLVITSLSRAARRRQRLQRSTAHVSRNAHGVRRVPVPRARFGGARLGPDRPGHADRHRRRQQRRRRPRGHRHGNQSGDQRQLHRRHQRCRHVCHHQRADRQLCREGRADWLQGRPIDRGVVGRANRPRRLHAPDRRHRGTSRGRLHQRGAADRERCRRPDAAARTGREAAGAGPQPVDRRPLHRRGHHAQPELVQQPEEHWRRPALRQRPARTGQQLHARRRGHERRHRQPDRLPAEPGRGGAGQRRDQQLLARARQRRRGDRQHGHQVGKQQHPRQRLLLLARQRPGGDAVGDQPGRRPQSGVHPQDLRRHRWRADREEPAVLLRRLPGWTPEVAAGRFVHDGAPRRLAQRRSEQSPRGEHADCRLRSADWPAVPEQPDSGGPLQPVRA